MNSTRPLASYWTQLAPSRFFGTPKYRKYEEHRTRRCSVRRTKCAVRRTLTFGIRNRNNRWRYTDIILQKKYASACPTFSTVWKNILRVFHTMENPEYMLPPTRFPIPIIRLNRITKNEEKAEQGVPPYRAQGPTSRRVWYNPPSRGRHLLFMCAIR
jgi:hypothetical protein